MKAGLVGQTITILDILQYQIKDIEGNYGSYDDEKKIEGKE